MDFTDGTMGGKVLSLQEAYKKIEVLETALSELTRKYDEATNDGYHMIAENTNLNDCVKYRRYMALTNKVAQTLPNTPTGEAFWIENRGEISNSGWLTQELTTYEAQSNHRYVRTYEAWNTDKWTAWKQVW